MTHFEHTILTPIFNTLSLAHATSADWVQSAHLCRDEICCSAEAAIEVMRQLNKHTTPFAKLCCLGDVSQMLSSSVEEVH